MTSCGSTLLRASGNCSRNSFSCAAWKTNKCSKQLHDEILKYSKDHKSNHHDSQDITLCTLSPTIPIGYALQCQLCRSNTAKNSQSVQAPPCPEPPSGVQPDLDPGRTSTDLIASPAPSCPCLNTFQHIRLTPQELDTVKGKNTYIKFKMMRNSTLQQHLAWLLQLSLGGPSYLCKGPALSCFLLRVSGHSRTCDQQ